jgi:hypothetical protein
VGSPEIKYQPSGWYFFMRSLLGIVADLEMGKGFTKVRCYAGLNPLSLSII